MGWSEALRRNSKSLTIGVDRDRLAEIYYGPFRAYEDGSISAAPEDFRRLRELMLEAGTQDFEVELAGGVAAVTLMLLDMESHPCLAAIAIDTERGQTGLWLHAQGLGGVGDGWMVSQPAVALAPSLLPAPTRDSESFAFGDADTLLVASVLGWLLANPSAVAETPLLSFCFAEDLVLEMTADRPAAGLPAARNPLVVEGTPGLEALLSVSRREAERVGAGTALERSISLGYSDGIWVTLGDLSLSRQPLLTVGVAPGLDPSGSFLSAHLVPTGDKIGLVPLRRNPDDGSLRSILPVQILGTQAAAGDRWALAVARDALREIGGRLDEVPGIADAWQAEWLDAMLSAEREEDPAAPR